MCPLHVGEDAQTHPSDKRVSENHLKVPLPTDQTGKNPTVRKQKAARMLLDISEITNADSL